MVQTATLMELDLLVVLLLSTGFSRELMCHLIICLQVQEIVVNQLVSRNMHQKEISHCFRSYEAHLLFFLHLDCQVMKSSKKLMVCERERM